MILRITTAILLCFSVCAVATEVNRLAIAKEPAQRNLDQPKGWWPFLGAGLGLMSRSDDQRTGGVPAHFKILGSYYFEQSPWIADLGIGLHNHTLTQKGGDDDTIQSLYTELAARYEISNRWQLGAIWNTLVDNPDRYQSNTENLASFMGVQVMKEFILNDEYLVRAGGRAMTDVGISGEIIDTVMAEIEVSFGKGARRTAQTPTPQETPVAPHLASRAMQTYLLDPGPVHFESDSTKLMRSSRSYLQRLARALAANRHLFETIEVIGHTDQRGPVVYNERLSERRARTISDSLVAAGINRGQVKAVGRGKSQLLSTATTPAAMLRNRRVQVEFHGVQNQVALKNIIDSVSR